MATNNATTSVINSLQNAVTQQVQNLNTGINPSVISNAVASALQTQASSIVNNVYSAGNSTLNTLPSQIVGPNNPINIVSSNQGSAGLFNNLNNSINNAVTPQATQNLVNALQTQLTAVLPANSPALTNFNNQLNNLSTNLSASVGQAVNSTFQSFTNSIFSNNPTVNSVISGIAGLFGGVSSTTPSGFSLDFVFQALEQIDLNFSNSLTDETLKLADNFNIENPDNNDKLVATKVGFMDPSATYPTKEYAGQPETNKLTRGEINGTIVQKKNDDRVIGAKLPFNNSFDEPTSPYNGEYPYNKVTQTESGHVIEIDDTPGNERLHIYHRSGTYVEIDSNGSVVKRTRGSSYEIIDCNGKIAILGKADISINGACNIFVGNDVNMEVIGDVNLVCHNDITAQAGGTLNLSAKEEINLHAEVVNIEADKALNILSDGNVKLLSGVETHFKSNTDTFISADKTIHINANTDAFMSSTEAMNLTGKTGVKIFSDADMDLKASSKVNIQAESDTNVKAGGKVNLQSGSSTNIRASGNFNADGSQVYLKSDTADSAGDATIAEFAKAAALSPVSNVGLLEGRKYVDIVEITDPIPIRFDARYSEVAEGGELSTTELNKQKDNLVLSGIATKDELDDPNPVVIEEKSPSSTQGKILMPDEKLLKVTELPGNYQLSPNYTLDNMWRTVAVSPGKHPLRAQVGLTYGQIVYNLQALALNVLEPVRALYPKVIITSAFRHEQDNAKSAHPAGLACDLQFPGASREDYYDIAVKLAQVLSYDQVLLEYWVQANNPWIHIGLAPRGQFSPASQRKVAWTFKDHKLYKQSLVNLA